MPLPPLTAPSVTLTGAAADWPRLNDEHHARPAREVEWNVRELTAARRKFEL